MLDHFWDAYRTYREAGGRDRIALPVPGGGAIELYYSMSSIRAAFKPDIPAFVDHDAWDKAVLGFVSEHRLLTDFRDESHVLTNQEGVYYARLRLHEFLFPPQRFEEQIDLLEDLVALYRSAEPPRD